MAEQLGTLLVSCPDQKGIVAALAQVLFGQGANITDSDQHTDPIAGMFFQRICSIRERPSCSTDRRLGSTAESG